MTKIEDIVGKKLDVAYLKEAVFRQIADSENSNFISQSTKNSLRAYVDDSNIVASKNLWKDLLIDAIAILKINDYREKIYNDAKKDNNGFFAAFEDIRKTNSYGINEIDKYFDEFIEFESVLYGIDKHYRNHVEHVLQVWAIGISLIVNKKISLYDGFKINNDFHFMIADDAPQDKPKSISKSELWSMWTIVALCHDLGYPIEKTSQINRQAKKIISHFGNIQFTELNYNFDIFNTFLVEKFIDIISSKATINDIGNEGYTSIQTKYRDKLSKSIEDYRHGVFSSLLLFKNLTYFLETDYYISKSNLSAEDTRQFYIRKEILRAMAGHTCPKIYHIHLNTLPFLLILCDELQEWNRPKFNEFINGASKTEPEVFLKIFETDPVQKITIELDYKEIEISKSEEERKYYVDNRFKMLHCLLRSAKDDSERKIIFEWIIGFRNMRYSFLFDSTQNSFNILNTKKQRVSSSGEDNSKEIFNLYD